MAMFDDVDFLIKQIRNSFITSDDTGMCEMIMECEDLEKRRSSLQSTTDESGIDSENELSRSYDILPDMDYGTRRRRSNTAVRLERLKKEKKTQVKVRHVPWRSSSFSGYNNELFTRKELKPISKVQGKTKRTSLLANLIDTYGVVSNNPFVEFSKFDGRANLGVATKKIEIYLTMASPRDRPYPMTIVIVSSAKVRELIGYICWQYTTEGREPPLQENSNQYSLHIAEDDGEVDEDFPCLDVREPVSKFGFAQLALVERPPIAQNYPIDSVVVTINIPGKGFSKVPVDDAEVTLRHILERVVAKRKMITHPGIEYNLEKQGQPGVSLDLDATLASFDDYEFCVVRRNSCRVDLTDTDMNDTSDSFTSHRYKTYVVSLTHKLRASTDVQLGISGAKVDIDPVSRKTSSRLFRFKAMTLDMDSIVACNIVHEKSSGRTSFRLTYSMHNEHKDLDFETDNETATQIVQKFNSIFEWRLTPSESTPILRDKRLSRKRDNMFSKYLTK